MTDAERGSEAQGVLEAIRLLQEAHTALHSVPVESLSMFQGAILNHAARHINDALYALRLKGQPERALH